MITQIHITNWRQNFVNFLLNNFIELLQNRKEKFAHYRKTFSHKNLVASFKANNFLIRKQKC